VTIDSDAEWKRFQEVSKTWKNHKYQQGRMTKPEWCKAWVGARKRADNWQWVGGGDVPDGYFAEGQVNSQARGRGFGAIKLNNADPDDADAINNGKIFDRQSVDWGVHGYVIERQDSWASTYTLNGWAVSGHPRARELGERQFYQSMQEAGGELPLFSEGTGPIVRPTATDRAPKDFNYGDQQGKGMGRVCIDRYGNGHNNVAFADGSVRNVPFRELWNLEWHRGWKSPRTVQGLK
jgi:prepilin-type processing-associated H-X9-DG protein